MAPRRSGIAVLAAILLGISVWTAAPSSAAVSVTPVPSFPSSVPVGQTFSASVGINNSSSAPETTTNPLLTISAIDLYAACSTSATDCAGGTAAGGVYTFASNGTGVGPASCAGTWTIVPDTGTSSTATRFRLVPPGGEGTLQLAAGEICVVSFSATLLRVPPIDVNPGVPGVQTFQVASSTTTGPTVAPLRTTGVDQSTVMQASPTLSTTATQSGSTVPATTSATATLGPPPAPSSANGAAPTGTITFDLFGPDDRTCAGTPVFTSAAPVSGFGSYASPMTASLAGPGTYRWRATYSGDANYLGSSTGCSGATVTVTGSGLDAASDFDGDGKTDVAVFRPAGGTWFVHRSSGGDTVGNYGVSTDIPVPADYDGDGKADVAVFRPGTGTWFVHRSSGGDTVLSFGVNGDIPVPGDYDGDGRADVAVFRPANGTWYVHNSAGGDTITAHGMNGDIPVPGDYDEDGRVDLAVFRPATGAWFVDKSAGGELVGAYGTSGDVPLPLPAAIRMRFF